jgi:hypothetical protein
MFWCDNGLKAFYKIVTSHDKRNNNVFYWRDENINTYKFIYKIIYEWIFIFLK